MLRAIVKEDNKVDQNGNTAMRVLLMRNETKETHNTEPVTLAVVHHYGMHEHQSGANSDRKQFNSFPVCGHFCRLLIIFANIAGSNPFDTLIVLLNVFEKS